MKKAILVACAAFGLNVAVAQTTSNPQTPGVPPNTPDQTTPDMQNPKTGTQNSDGSHKNSTTNKPTGSKKQTGKTNSAGNKNSSNEQSIDGTATPKSTNGTNSQNPSTGAPKQEN